MKTAMQELKSDLVVTLETSAKALEEIHDTRIKLACQMVVKKTIDAVISRIDTELLEMEEKQINEAYNQGQMDGFGLEEKDDYYSETFKSE